MRAEACPTPSDNSLPSAFSKLSPAPTVGALGASGGVSKLGGRSRWGCRRQSAHARVLIETWKQMNRKGASGVDGKTTKEFENDLEMKFEQFVRAAQGEEYQPPPVRRVEGKGANR